MQTSLEKENRQLMMEIKKKEKFREILFVCEYDRKKHVNWRNVEPSANNSMPLKSHLEIREKFML